MEFKVEAASHLRRKFLTAIMPSMIEQLGLTNSRKCVLVRVADECPGMGMTVPLDGLDAYVVILSPKSRLATLGTTLAHEMVHVRQMAKGILKSTTRGAHIWSGKRYSKNTEYLEQPWEVQAFQQQELIFRKAIQ